MSLKRFSIGSILLLFCCLALQVTAFQSQPLKLNAQDNLNLRGYISYLEDRSKKITPNEVINSEALQQFAPFNLANDSIGVTDSVWWFKFTLDFSSISNETRLLLLNNPLIYDARLYQHINGNLKELNHGGFAFPANERAVFDAELIFPLKNQSGQSEYFLRIENSGALQVPLSIWKPEALSGKKNISHWISGIYYGLIISMAIYNLFIGWSTGIKAYFYYVGYLFALAMTISFNDGYAQLLIFPNSPYVAYIGINWASALVVIFASQFAREFLNTKTNTPLIDKWLLGNIAASIFFLTFNYFFDGATSANIILGLILIFMMSMFSVGIACWLKQVRAARYFVFSWVFMVLGTFMMALTKLGLFPAVAIGEFGTHIGSAIEAMLLSFALADRIRWLEEQRIDAERKTRNALEISHKKLEESNRVKDEFFSLLSHELRTPMNGIRGIVDLFKQEKFTDTQAKNLRILSESTDEMLGHVDQLLVFSQLKSDHLKLNQRPFNLDDLLSRLGAHCHIICDEQKINFIISHEKFLAPELVGDERVLFVILNQLLDSHLKCKNLKNLSLSITQIKTIDEYEFDIEFSIESKRATETKKSLTSSKQKSSDIAADYINSDVSPDLSNESILVGNVESILNHKLVHLLHGKLTEENSVPSIHKTKLLLSFKQAVSREKHFETDEETRKRRGLVVDDNSVNRIVACKYLEQLGYVVDAVSDGEEALHILNNSSYDFILMDCHMPILNGFEATTLIRQGQVAPHIPIIAVTADVTAESTQECLKCGMNEVLHKPLRLDILSETLRLQGLFPKAQAR